MKATIKHHDYWSPSTRRYAPGKQAAFWRRVWFEAERFALTLLILALLYIVVVSLLSVALVLFGGSGLALIGFLMAVVWWARTRQ